MMKRFATPFVFLCFVLSGCGTEPTPVYTITTDVDPADAGSVSPSNATFDEGTEADFTATANEHWVFSGWEGRSTSENPLTFTVNNDGSIIALFEKMEYALDTEVEGNGRILQEAVTSLSDYDHGTSVQLTADPFAHWSFVEWTGDLTGSENPVTIEIDGEKSIGAVFEKTEFTVTTEEVDNGQISLTPEKEYYDKGESIEIFADAVDGWELKEWTSGLEGSENPVTVSIDSDMSIGASFNIKTYKVESSTSGNGSVEITPAQDEYNHGDEISMEADPDGGWKFSGWTGDITSNENPHSFDISENIEVVATFEECTDPEECISTNFYSSVTVGNYVFDSNLQFSNNLSSDVLLKSVIIKRGDGGTAAQNESIDTSLNPGESSTLSASYLPQPTLEQFTDFTAEWTFEHNGVEKTVTTDAKNISL